MGVFSWMPSESSVLLLVSPTLPTPASNPSRSQKQHKEHDLGVPSVCSAQISVLRITTFSFHLHILRSLVPFFFMSSVFLIQTFVSLLVCSASLFDLRVDGTGEGHPHYLDVKFLT